MPRRPATGDLPETVDNWHELVRKHRAGAKTLGEVGVAKSFSGSTIHTAAFLQLRALWPEADDTTNAADDLQDAGLFGVEDLRLAGDLLDDMARGDDALKLFTKEIAAHVATARTPMSRSTGADRPALGWFGPSMVLWRRLTSQPNTTRMTSSHHTGPPTGLLASPAPKLDLKKQAAPRPHVNEEDGDTDGDDGLAELNNLLDGLQLGFAETPSKPPRISGTTTDKSRLGGFRSQSAPAIRMDPEADLLRNIDFPDAAAYDNTRTRYEVHTTIFFTTYVTSLLACAIGMELDAHVIVAAEERRYTFGQKSDPHAGGSGGGFNAAPDGAFYYRVSSDGRFEPFVLFEMKPFDWDETHAKKRDMCYEVTAQMAAFLYQQSYPRSPSSRPSLDGKSNETHCRVIVSQNHKSFWITLVSFQDSYLDYITDADQSALSVAGGDLTTRDMIIFQRFGPFQFVRSKDVEKFNLIITAMVLAQLRVTEGGSDLRRRCEAAVAGFNAVSGAAGAAW